MNLHPNTEGLKVRREQQAAAKAKNAKRIMEMIINSDGGLSVKEIAINMNLASATIREYIKDLIESGSIYAAGKEGKTVIYKVTEVADSKAEVPEVKEEIMPVGHSGKEFAPGSYIPVTDKCRPGDVIWISSRSGEGAFFRYLIITPWEHKAMVLGVFEEGYGKLDLNDPYYVFIGNDPETGKKLYADLRNNCQRGYKQFGERLMHVDQDSFDVVKCRLARSMGIDRMKIEEADPDVVRLLKERLDKAKAAVSAISKDRNDIRTALDECERVNNELKTEVNDQASTITELNNQLIKAGSELAATNLKILSLEECNGNQAETIKELEERNANLEKAVNKPDDRLEKYEPAVFDGDLFTGMVIDSKVKETKIQMLEDQVKMLRQMIFNMIKGGKDS